MDEPRNPSNADTVNPEWEQQLIRAVIDAADPGSALAAAWAMHWHDQPQHHPVHVLAIGKAALAMTVSGLPNNVLRSARALMLMVPRELESQAQAALPDGEVHGCDHPYPTDANVLATQRVKRFVCAVKSDETLVVLLSGGTSAYLCDPWASEQSALSLTDIIDVTRALQLAGATIGELNCVRKHCETLKGGRLAAACRGRVIGFVLSDVIGDNMDVIGSGPISPDPTTFGDALDVLRKYGLTDKLPRIAAHLQCGVRGELPETIKPGDPRGDHAHTVIIGSNKLVVGGAADLLRRMGVQAIQTRCSVEGESSRVARELLDQVAGLPAGGAVVFGGEWTVTVGDAADGKGGPSQELALAAAVELERRRELADVRVLAFSTDGRDGPTDAAGGVVTAGTASAMRAKGIDPAESLRKHDSWAALAAAGTLVRVAPTGTNLNHIAVAVRGGL